MDGAHAYEADDGTADDHGDDNSSVSADDVGLQWGLSA